MKNFFVVSLFLTAFSPVILDAQTQTAEEAHKEIMAAFPDNGYQKTLDKLDESLKTYPNDYNLLRDKVMLNYLNRNYSGVILDSKTLLNRKDADEQLFKIVGDTYVAIAANDDAVKTYKKGLEVFPQSGLLYNALGSLAADNGNVAGAIEAFEKGVQGDPNISSNYYSLSKLYSKFNNPLWSVLYGEMFVNLESKTSRCGEIKLLLPQQYGALFASPAVLEKYATVGKPFEKAMAPLLIKYKDYLKDGVTVEGLANLRGQFLADWFLSDNAKNFPFRLFDRERQLIKQGDFEAYNQWLFSAVSEQAFNNWAAAHAQSIKSFENYQNAVIFKPAKEEYYAH